MDRQTKLNKICFGLGTVGRDLDLNELIALINPMLPMLIKSSKSVSTFSNFLAIYTTNLKLCTIKVSLATLSPFAASIDNFASSS